MSEANLMCGVATAGKLASRSFSLIMLGFKKKRRKGTYQVYYM